MSKQKYPQATVTTTSDGSKTVRKGRDHYSSAKLWAKRDRKRQEAYDRQDKYDRLSDEQKIATLVPGGSRRQRARFEAKFLKQLQSTLKKPAPAPVVTAEAPVKVKKAKVKKVRVTPTE